MTAVAIADRGLDAVIAEASRRTGISFAGARGTWLAEGLRAAFGGDEAGGRWLDQVLVDEALFARLCDHVTVQESFFFREPSRFDLLRHAILPSIGELDRPLRIWSAGCAAGEEAYSLGIVLRDAGYGGRYRVVGTDLSASAIATARGGVYNRWALRGLPDEEVTRHFNLERAGFRLRDELRADVSFVRRNLLDPPPIEQGHFDVIFCRNVLIYLTPEAIHTAVQEMAAALVPGGWLVTSASDPLLDEVTSLEPVLTRHGLAYRRRVPGFVAQTPHVRTDAAPKPLDAVRRPSLPVTSTRAPVETAMPVETAVAADEQLARAERALQRAQPRRAEQITATLLEVKPSARAHALLIQAVAAENEMGRACEAARNACHAFPLDGRLRYLLAVVQLELGRPEEAVGAAREAVYLDPQLAEAHLVLARSHQLLGHDAAAERSRRAGLRLLEASGR